MAVVVMAPSLALTRDSIHATLSLRAEADPTVPRFAAAVYECVEEAGQIIPKQRPHGRDRQAVWSRNPMDQFLTDVLALAGENFDAIRSPRRCGRSLTDL